MGEMDSLVTSLIPPPLSLWHVGARCLLLIGRRIGCLISPEPGFLNIYGRLESQLFATVVFSKVREYNNVRTGFSFCKWYNKKLFYINFNRPEKWSKSYSYCTSFIIKNIIKLNWNPVLALSAELNFKMFQNSGSGNNKTAHWHWHI